MAVPVGASATNDSATASAAVASVPSESVQAFDQAGTYSDASLAGTGVVFLLFGIGTVSLAHRRRWRTIDVRDRTLDLRDGASKEAHA